MNYNFTDQKSPFDIPTQTINIVHTLFSTFNLIVYLYDRRHIIFIYVLALFYYFITLKTPTIPINNIPTSAYFSVHHYIMFNIICRNSNHRDRLGTTICKKNLSNSSVTNIIFIFKFLIAISLNYLAQQLQF